MGSLSIFILFCKNGKDSAVNTRLVGILIDSFPNILINGLTVTLPLTIISFALALVIALITALVQTAKIPVLRQLARFYVWVIRGTPVLVQLFVVFYGLPSLGVLIDPFPAAVACFAINEGAYCAETIRAALESVPAGQMEAGYCVGMTYLQTMRRIVPAGTAHGVPAAVQLADFPAQRYLPCRKHYGNRDVYGHPAHCGAHL